MGLSFNNIPADIRVPLFYAEVDNSAANTATSTKQSLLIGQTSTTNVPNLQLGKAYLISSVSQARTTFGRGSQLALMVEAFKNQNATGTLWCIPVEVEGSKAKGQVDFEGEVVSAGTLSFYVGAKKVAVSCTSGDDAITIASRFMSTINNDSDLPVRATVLSTTTEDESGESTTETVPTSIVLTAIDNGTYGDDILLSVNRKAYIGGEENVEGLNVTISQMSGGTGEIDLSKLTSLFEGDTFSYICSPTSDATVLDAWKAEMNDSTGRWSYARMQYGHVFSCLRGSAEELVTKGNSINDQHQSIVGIEPNFPEPAWLVAAAVTGRASAYLSIDPARPLQTGVLNGISGPLLEDKFGFTDRNTLLHNGIATLYEQSGNVMIERCITTYKTNAFGDADNSYLDVTTLFTLAEIINTLKTAITSKYARHKLADDGTKFGPGQAIVTPSVIRSELVAQYAKLETKGIVENSTLFNKYLIVERNADDPCRIDVLLPPDLVNQLRIFALQAQFRLQYSATD